MAIVKSPLADMVRFDGALLFNFRSAMLAWAFAPIVGILCVLTHWLVIPRPNERLTLLQSVAAVFSLSFANAADEQPVKGMSS
jgi:hypothetical protein